MAYAAVYGLKTDTNLQGQEYSWLGSIFYFGYLGMEFPALWFLTKIPIGKYVGVMLFCWGACLCGMAGCNNFAGLAAVRFLLGVFEAGILPCFMVLTSVWYSRNEQPIRTALWYNTFAGVSYLALIDRFCRLIELDLWGYSKLCDRAYIRSISHLEGRFVLQ
jgi:MFS family permease